MDPSDRQVRIILVLSAERDAASIIAAPLTGLGHKVVATPYGPTALDLGRNARIVVVDNTPGAASTDVVASIKSRPDLASLPLLAIARSDTVEERIELLEAGADDVMATPIDAQELAARVDGLLRRAQVTTASQLTVVTPATRPTGLRLLAFFAAKGGVGSTTIAVNTAICLAARGARTVALIDLDPWWGQVATQLDMAPRMSVAELARDMAGADDLETVRAYALQHPSGVSVFTSPIRPDTSTPPTTEQLECVLDALGAGYDYVVVDAGSALDERAQVVLGRADRVVICVTPDIPAVRATRMLIEQLAEYEAPTERHVVVLNHIFAAEVVKTEDLRRSLQLPVDDEIPYDPILFLKAANEGIPVVISAPSSPPAQAFRRLAATLVGPVTPEPAAAPSLRGKRPLLRGLLGRS
ncbi:MAG: AAA family ATPase [Candidatus Limnocylindrales bacterium]